jgi:hypothetical protein
MTDYSAPHEWLALAALASWDGNRGTAEFFESIALLTADANRYFDALQRRAERDLWGLE